MREWQVIRQPINEVAALAIGASCLFILGWTHQTINIEKCQIVGENTVGTFEGEASIDADAEVDLTGGDEPMKKEAAIEVPEGTDVETPRSEEPPESIDEPNSGIPKTLPNGEGIQWVPSASAEALATAFSPARPGYEWVGFEFTANDLPEPTTVELRTIFPFVLPEASPRLEPGQSLRIYLNADPDVSGNPTEQTCLAEFSAARVPALSRRATVSLAILFLGVITLILHFRKSLHARGS